MYLYALLLVFTILFPILFGQTRKYSFNHLWKPIFIRSLFVSIPFIIWDMWFVAAQYWGFNSEYLIGWYLLNLPIEEWLFFTLIPIASIFLYYCVKQHSWTAWITPPLVLGTKVTLVLVSLILICYLRPYSLIAGIMSLITLGLTWRSKWWPNLIMYMPFGLVSFLGVNGLLTSGLTSISPNPIVWYEPTAFSQIRITSIPVEDFFFGFSLVGLNIWLFEKYLKINP